MLIRRYARAIPAIFILCGLLVPALPSRVLAANLKANAGGKSKKIAGTYFGHGVIESGTPALPPFITPGFQFQTLIILTREGIALGRNSFGPPGRNVTPGFGTWKRMDGHRVKILFFYFDMDQNGQLMFKGRVSGIVTFDQDFESFEGSLENELFLPFQDPLDPAEVPIGVINGTFGATKISL